MAERHVNIKAGDDGAPPPLGLIGRAFAYRSSIWRIKGLYFTATPSGGRELWWILGEQETEASELDGGGEL